MCRYPFLVADDFLSLPAKIIHDSRSKFMLINLNLFTCIDLTSVFQFNVTLLFLIVLKHNAANSSTF